jgi:TonB family protein
MAPPSSETLREAPQSVAPTQGTGESERRARLTWQKELAVHLDRNKRYPSDRAQREAQVVIAFVLDRTGHVLSATIAQSSGDASFDQAALAMMRRADPVPAPPALVADEGLSFSLPVNFRAQRRK